MGMQRLVHRPDDAASGGHRRFLSEYGGESGKATLGWLMILGLLAGRGPMEGQQIRWADELANAGASGSIHRLGTASALGHLVAALGGLDRRPGALIAASSRSVTTVSAWGTATSRPTSPAPAGRTGGVPTARRLSRPRCRPGSTGSALWSCVPGMCLRPPAWASQVMQSPAAPRWVDRNRAGLDPVDPHRRRKRACHRFRAAAPGHRRTGQPHRSRAGQGTPAPPGLRPGAVSGRRAWLPVPAPLCPDGRLGAVTDILARGKRVVPAKATSAGYPFRFPVP